MKTSNIIITSLIGGLVLIVLTAAVELRFFGKKNNFSRSLQTIDSVGISNFKYLVVEGFRATPYLKKGNSNYLELSALKLEEDSIPDDIKVKYSVENDTLFIKSSKYHMGVTFTLTCSDTIYSIQLKNTYFEVTNVPVNNFVTDNSKLKIEGFRKTSRINIQGINKSRIDINQANDTIVFDLNASKMSINRIVNTVTGKLQQSNLRIGEVNHLDIDKDLESTMDIR